MNAHNPWVRADPASWDQLVPYLKKIFGTNQDLIIFADGTMSSPVMVPEHEPSRLIYSKNTKNVLDAFDAFPVEGNYNEYSDESGCTDKWANSHGMPFRTQVKRF